MAFISVDRRHIQAQDLFPLPLVAMERFWLWDDVPSHPKRFRVVIALTGWVDVPRMEKSIAIAGSRHPLLISVIDRKGRSPQWIIPEGPRIAWRWNTGTWQESPFSDDWDLTQEGGLRMWGRQNGKAAEISVETHHAASDALGLRQFLRDVFLAYDRLAKEPNSQPELPRLVSERLLHRGEFLRPAPTEDTRSTTAWEKMMGAFHFHCRGPIPIASAALPSPAEPAVRRHYYFRHTFEASETLRIDTPSVLNDWAIARMLRVLADWNTEHGQVAAHQRLRILIPTDLRTLRDSRSPASNRLGFGFVVATIGECRDLQRLLPIVRSQTQSIRRYRLGLDFVEIFGLLAKRPKLGAWLVRRPNCLATAVLTNLGDAMGRFRNLYDIVNGQMKLGELVVESMAGYPPLRPKTGVGVGLSRYAGRLTMGMVVDAEQFTHAQAQQLHAKWVQSWLDLPSPINL